MLHLPKFSKNNINGRWRTNWREYANGEGTFVDVVIQSDKNGKALASYNHHDGKINAVYCLGGSALEGTWSQSNGKEMHGKFILISQQIKGTDGKELLFGKWTYTNKDGEEIGKSYDWMGYRIDED